MKEKTSKSTGVDVKAIKREMLLKRIARLESFQYTEGNELLRKIGSDEILHLREEIRRMDHEEA